MKELFKKLLAKTGYALINLDAVNAPQKQNQITRNNFFDLYFAKIPKDFFFVAIGASDGVSSDPLYPYILKHNLRGVTVEPLPDSFELLKNNYKKFKNITIVNAAIGEKSLPFWRVKDGTPSDRSKISLNQISSFNKNSLIRELSKRIPKTLKAEDFIEEVKINTLSLKELFDNYQIDNINFLQLDCEGYDYEILKQFDFNKFSPEVINFESFHFNDETRKKCEDLLTSQGYKFFRYGGDTCAYKV